MLRNRSNTLIRVNPLHELDPFRGWPFVPVQWRNDLARTNEAGRKGFQSSLLNSSLAAESLPVDIVVNDASYSLHLEIPGTTREDIRVEFHEKTLTIKGERKRRELVDGDIRHRTERRYGTFERSFRLPADVEEDKVRAQYRDGVLTIEIPRLAPSKPQSIAIEE